jgi:hypothetical protein
VKFRTRQDYVRLLPQAAAYDRAEVAELRKLVPPTSDRADWLQIVNGLQKFSEYSSKVGEELGLNDVAVAQTYLLAGSTTRADVAAIATRDGFKECAHV